MTSSGGLFSPDEAIAPLYSRGSSLLRAIGKPRWYEIILVGRSQVMEVGKGRKECVRKFMLCDSGSDEGSGEK